MNIDGVADGFAAVCNRITKVSNAIVLNKKERGGFFFLLKAIKAPNNLSYG
jgi:hypothetical protein